MTQKGQGHDPNIFGPIISTMVGDTDLVPVPIGNDYLGFEWSRD